jgi:hypothetical protein
MLCVYGTCAALRERGLCVWWAWLGRFDPLESQPYTNIPFSALGSPAHTALSFDGALQGKPVPRHSPLPPNSIACPLPTCAH